MNTFVRSAAITVMILFIWLSSGCREPLSKESIAGYYTLVVAAGTIELDLHSDGSFRETIRPVGKPSTTRNGGWAAPDSTSPQIGLDGLWIPREFAPEFIQRADASSKGVTKYTEPGYWIAKPSYEFGKIVIPIFPDADVKFVRTTRRNASR